MSDQDEKQEVELTFHHETDRAWKVSENGEDDDAFWLPKSRCDCWVENPEVGETTTFYIPGWLMEANGLV